ncbi:MAG: bifunctional helix-turn-helix transcriptional regulator/GNAT family N-acetyltransferase [Proteobacteria bacterium]|nr:bifunctional helix-turn-helix transcriptional regulator/GNAT family N-acetyltransferase [Pseudomonadota bacterium]
MLDDDISAVRHFSRYYTRRIGVLEDSLLGSGLSLPQGRLLFEIAQSDKAMATPGALASLLGLDAGYVSRLVAALESRGLVRREASASDGRSVRLVLTADGRRAFRDMDARSRDEIGKLLGAIPGPARGRVVEAMRAIEAGLDPATSSDVRLRDPVPGDIGWVVHRHGALYRQEYGWDCTFEALVAKVASEFIEKFDAKLDCCRIAEVGGAIVGAAFVVRSDKRGTAKLRLVYVEPEMRGSGLGRALVEDCMAFARKAGYSRMTLWTNDVLLAARRLYQRLGFEMTASEPYRGFGHNLVGETWERDL